MIARSTIRFSLLFLIMMWVCLSVAAQRRPTGPDSLTSRTASPVGALNDYREEPSFTSHNQGKLAITLSNTGGFGLPRDNMAFWKPTRDPLSREDVYYCMYPKETGIVWALYLNTTIGGIRGDDTVVAGWSYPWKNDWPEYYTFKFESASRAVMSIYTDSARSDLDIYCAYIDTVAQGRGSYAHKPTMLKVRQRSMAWSGGGSDDFILVEDRIQNIGTETLRELYVGIGIDARVFHISVLEDTLYPQQQPVLTGFLASFEPDGECATPSAINLAYVMSADGRPGIKQWTKDSPLGAVGLRMINVPAKVPRVNYNWFAWTLTYFEPRLRGTADDPFRPYDRGSRRPYSEQDQYYALRHREIDYDQMTTALNHYWEGWQTTPGYAADIAGGAESGATLSFGTFDLPPGAVATVVYAIVGGDSVHVEPTDYDRLWNPDRPQYYYNSLNFKGLADNARWAGYVYDNPGVDTDDDGYAGEYTICEGDTVWSRGDGVPDWKSDNPPPSPELHVSTDQGRLIVRWNGFFSETTPDQLTRVRDFEGYRVYLGLDSRASSLSLIRSFDYENYIRYRMAKLGTGKWVWHATDLPLSLDSLRRYYNDPLFEPLVYDREHPLDINGEYFCFYMQSYNSSQLTADGIHKAYPEAVKPSMDSLQWTDDEVTTEHGRRLPKYYEYEIVIGDLLPTIEYWVSVTAFDFGFATGDIPAQESNKYLNLTQAWAVRSAEEVAQENLNVYVWPNPYRYDGNYADGGYENHDQSLWYDRARRIHFGNLPNKCTISILSLDGDLVKEIHHDYPAADPRAAHDAWDLISRASLLAVSGIYYWVVEGGGRTQMGKLVVIE